MALNKYSYESDAIANLYRAALYLARGSKEIGLGFLIKAQEKLGDRLDSKLISLIDRRKDYLKDTKDRLYWAEKILDEYHRLKHGLFLSK